METNEAKNTYYCPYCAGAFRAEEVLFVDEDKTGAVTNENEYDPEQYEFQKQVITFNNTTTWKGEPIQIESRPKYKYHRWFRPDDANLPYQDPIRVSGGSSPIPEDITIYRSKGMTPNQLAGREPAPWEHATSSVEEEKPEEPEKPVSTGELLRNMMLSGMANQQKANKAASVEQNIMPSDVEKTLTDKACPRCHCILPEQFGAIPTYRIAMLGGTASGKTTYMVAVANLLSRMNGLPSGVVNGCRISAESKRYFDYLIKCLENDKLASTPVVETTFIRFVFPIVMNMTTVTDDGMNEREFILILNDIPGEAMENKAFLMSYPGLLEANAAIMLMDPFQFIGPMKQKDLVKKDMEMLGMETSDPDAVRQHALSFTPTAFDKTQGNIKAMMTQSKFARMESFVMVLNKLDLLYGGKVPIINVQDDSTLRCVNGQYELNAQHEDGMDMVFIEQLSNQVVYIIEKKLGYSTYHTAINSMVSSLPVGIDTLCISIRSWNAGEGEFASDRDEHGFISANEMIGFRMLEPLLVTLAHLKLVRTKEHVEEVEEEEIPKRRWSLFRRR